MTIDQVSRLDSAKRRTISYLLNRLAEASTWRGVIWLAVGFGMLPAQAADETLDSVLTVIKGATALVGLISILFPDNSQWITKTLGYGVIKGQEETATVPLPIPVKPPRPPAPAPTADEMRGGDR